MIVFNLQADAPSTVFYDVLSAITFIIFYYLFLLWYMADWSDTNK